MLRVAGPRYFRAIYCSSRLGLADFSSTSLASSNQPNAPLELDPSFQRLLRDVDISLNRHKDGTGSATSRPTIRELETVPVKDTDVLDLDDLPEGEFKQDHRETRKSPAAYFGSQKIGSVSIPLELQSRIGRIIADTDRTRLHSDAVRLFGNPETESTENEWDAQYDAKYRSWKQRARHFERDGTAFVSVALPAHYSVIYSVLDHAKRRLGPEWKVESVIDWGSGTGSSLWAALYSFQQVLPESSEVDDLRISTSLVSTYIGIDKREGLVAIGKRLLQDVELGALSLTWQKAFHDDDRVKRTEGRNTLAISSFMLSSLPTPLARKTLVKEMWESGAEVMILIDHSTETGFQHVVEARDYLLKVGKKEMEDPETEDWPVRGSHVVAPCPHDAKCPLDHGGNSKLICGFSQRLQRPSFVRLTKHSGVGHEDTGYSYVVVRRGARPITGSIKAGRIGEVGKRAAVREASSQVPIRELKLHGEHEEQHAHETERLPDLDLALAGSARMTDMEPSTQEHLEASLRREAFNWPRLVFPPLKKSGHIIIDACTPEGKIMRLTVPKSQGKQPFYDARKSSWGDIFPHEPKNPPQERHLPMRTKGEGGGYSGKGADIGKRGTKSKAAQNASYEELSKTLMSERRRARRERIRAAESRSSMG